MNKNNEKLSNILSALGGLIAICTIVVMYFLANEINQQKAVVEQQKEALSDTLAETKQDNLILEKTLIIGINNAQQFEYKEFNSGDTMKSTHDLTIPKPEPPISSLMNDINSLENVITSLQNAISSKNADEYLSVFADKVRYFSKQDVTKSIIEQEISEYWNKYRDQRIRFDFNTLAITKMKKNSWLAYIRVFNTDDDNVHTVMELHLNADMEITYINNFIKQ